MFSTSASTSTTHAQIELVIAEGKTLAVNHDPIYGTSLLVKKQVDAFNLARSNEARSSIRSMLPGGKKDNPGTCSIDVRQTKDTTWDIYLDYIEGANLEFDGLTAKEKLRSMLECVHLGQVVEDSKFEQEVTSKLAEYVDERIHQTGGLPGLPDSANVLTALACFPKAEVISMAACRLMVKIAIIELERQQDEELAEQQGLVHAAQTAAQKKEAELQRLYRQQKNAKSVQEMVKTERAATLDELDVVREERAELEAKLESAMKGLHASKEQVKVLEAENAQLIAQDDEDVDEWCASARLHSKSATPSAPTLAPGTSAPTSAPTPAPTSALMPAAPTSAPTTTPTPVRVTRVQNKKLSQNLGNTLNTKQSPITPSVRKGRATKAGSATPTDQAGPTNKNAGKRKAADEDVIIVDSAPARKKRGTATATRSGGSESIFVQADDDDDEEGGEDVGDDFADLL
ncbi:hypothetical protein LTR17_022037 [Elasticomyces elasticus]|nr:hypothetical protein LTR17_022037 [Elasticomyces elasticus]